MKVVHNAPRTRFEVATESGLAQAQYVRRGETAVFTHTEVPDAVNGQGIGSALVEAALAWARAEGIAVVPSCPFVAAYMSEHPETHDLVPAKERKWLDPDYDERR